MLTLKHKFALRTRSSWLKQRGTRHVVVVFGKIALSLVYKWFVAVRAWLAYKYDEESVSRFVDCVEVD